MDLDLGQIARFLDDREALAAHLWDNGPDFNAAWAGVDGPGRAPQWSEVREVAPHYRKQYVALAEVVQRLLHAASDYGAETIEPSFEP